MKNLESITKTSKKKTWECDCGASGVVGEYTQALLCSRCGHMVNEFTPVKLLTEPMPVLENEINEKNFHS